MPLFLRAAMQPIPLSNFFALVAISLSLLVQLPKRDKFALFVVSSSAAAADAAAVGCLADAKLT